MPASKNPDSYPAAFAMLIAHFARSRAEVIQEYGKKGTAQRVRFMFYSYKKALEAKERTEDLRIADSVIVRLLERDGERAALSFSPRDETDFALDLEAAIRRAGEGRTEPTPEPTTQGRLALTGHASAPASGASAPAEPREDEMESLVANYMKERPC